MDDDSFVGNCGKYRTNVANLVAEFVAFKNGVQNSPIETGENRGEVMANLTLALRHLEDGAMRIGKAIQAKSGGVSPLGGPTTPTTASPKGDTSTAAGIIGK